MDHTVCLVFGNESNGLPESFLNSDMKKISIPQLGVLRSFNVSAAAAIVMWDFYKWWFRGIE
jgi:tRNA G18 (ribose-2'-O)-methylase SpoU